MKMDDNAQGSSFMYMMLFLLIMFIMMSTGIGNLLGYYFGLILEPTIGFGKNYPVLTLFLSGLMVVIFSSLLTNFFTDWKKMGESQELAKAFQKELTEARKAGDTSRVNKLMKMQPEIMRKQTESSAGMMKPMIFLIVFIWPIFMWLRGFLADLPYYYMTVPWANGVSFFDKSVLWQVWLWIYMLVSMIFGQIIRNGLKWISFSTWWENIREKISPSYK